MKPRAASRFKEEKVPCTSQAKSYAGIVKRCALSPTAPCFDNPESKMNNRREIGRHIYISRAESPHAVKSFGRHIWKELERQKSMDESGSYRRMTRCCKRTENAVWSI